MPAFARSFRVEALAAWEACQERGNAVRALFRRWALPGLPATPEVPLRLCIRDGYLNFYLKGQSVAELHSGAFGPRLKVHKAYTEADSTVKGAAPSPGRAYRLFDQETLGLDTMDGSVASWIISAERHACAEKRFVDDLVAANPGVLELEMALPASDLPNSDRVAPRMDVVVAQIDADQRTSVAFWEAKCAINSELRAKAEFAITSGGFIGPKVIHQVRRYVAWMAEPGRVDQVSSAYRATAQLLLQLHASFGRTGTDNAECLDIWKAFASADPEVVPQPGIVIGNYCPEGHGTSTAAEFARAAATFSANDHRAKLVDRNGLVVHEVELALGSAKLPHLKADPVTA